MITIMGSPKEIAALVDELQEWRDGSGVSHTQAWDLLREYQRIHDRKTPLSWERTDTTTAGTTAQGITSDKITGIGLRAEKLGDPAASGNRIEQFLRSKDQTSEGPDSNAEARKAP